MDVVLHLGEEPTWRATDRAYYRLCSVSYDVHQLASASVVARINARLSRDAAVTARVLPAGQSVEGFHLPASSVDALVLIAARLCAGVTTTHAIFGDMRGAALIEGMILAEYPEIQAAWIISDAVRRDTTVRLAQCGHNAVLADLRRLVWHYPPRTRGAPFGEREVRFLRSRALGSYAVPLYLDEIESSTE